MNKLTLQNLIVCVGMTFLSCMTYAQNETTEPTETYTRSKNAIMLAMGSSLINGDIIEPETEMFIQLQYKRFVSSKFNISGNLKKFDVDDFAFEDQGFLSGDLNLEWYMLPENRFTPYLFAGPGILASNDFKDQNYKIQGGFGLDYMITKSIALTASFEINYIYDVQKGSQLIQEGGEVYYNALIGFQFYFGHSKASKQKSKSQKATIINSNPIHVN